MSDSEDLQPDETADDSSSAWSSPLVGIVLMCLFVAAAIAIGMMLT